MDVDRYLRSVVVSRMETNGWEDEDFEGQGAGGGTQFNWSQWQRQQKEQDLGRQAILRSIPPPKEWMGGVDEYREWRQSLLNYLQLAIPQLPQAMERVELVEEEIPLPSDPAERAMAHMLQTQLFALVKGSAQSFVRSGPHSLTRNGLESWRRLASEYNPRSGGKTVALRAKVLSPPFSSGQSEAVWRKLFDKWQEQLSELESSSKSGGLSAADKTALLYERLPSVLRSQLDSQATEWEDQYSQLVDLVQKYWRKQRRYGENQQGEVVPMEIDSISKPASITSPCWFSPNLLCFLQYFCTRSTSWLY